MSAVCQIDEADTGPDGEPGRREQLLGSCAQSACGGLPEPMIASCNGICSISGHLRASQSISWHTAPCASVDGASCLEEALAGDGPH